MSSTPRILLVGYYGQGNFGDDLLLYVTHRLLKQTLPAAQFSVIVAGEKGAYVQQMLGDVALLPPGRHGHFDGIIHGGGGVFFDFARHGWLQQIYALAIRLFGWRNYLAAEKMLRSILGRPRTSAGVRLGIGIGVGSYSPGSPRLRAALPILADFKALWIRDTQSRAQLQKFHTILQGEIVEGSDLAFLTEHWRGTMPPRPAASRPRLGIALRDWPGADMAALQQTLTQLAQEYEITGFILDAAADPQLQQCLAPYPQHIWQPHTMQIADFTAALAAQDVLLASRAHGAIVGACLSVPAAIVAIEPKLEQVHAMLPNASVLVDAQQMQHWHAALAKALAIPPAAITGDVEKNRCASAGAWQQMQRWLA